MFHKHTHLACSYFIALALSNSVGQQTVSKPVSERTLDAGESFMVRVPLDQPAQQAITAKRQYILAADTTEQHHVTTSPMSGQDFWCYGNAQKGAIDITLICQTNQSDKSGDYYAQGDLTLTSPEGSGSMKMDDKYRFPIVSLRAFIPIVPPPARFPTISGGAVLILNEPQIIGEASEKADLLYHDLITHDLNGTSATNKRFLLSIAERAKQIVQQARQRYIDTTTKTKLPGFLQEFDVRLDELIRDLGGSAAASNPLETISHREVVLVTFQHPSHTEQENVYSGKDKADKLIAKTFDIVSDLKNGLDKMKVTGNHTATWMITSLPTGARVYHRSLAEPEELELGTTDLKGVVLDRQTWTFRVDWRGCSQSKRSNPFRTGSMSLTFKKDEGCEKK